MSFRPSGPSPALDTTYAIKPRGSSCSTRNFGSPLWPTCRPSMAGTVTIALREAASMSVTASRMPWLALAWSSPPSCQSGCADPVQPISAFGSGRSQPRTFRVYALPVYMGSSGPRAAFPSYPINITTWRQLYRPQVGDFVRNTAPAIAAGKVLLGWSRLVTGSANVAGTDWAPLYGTT